MYKIKRKLWLHLLLYFVGLIGTGVYVGMELICKMGLLPVWVPIVSIGVHIYAIIKIGERYMTD